MAEKKKATKKTAAKKKKTTKAKVNPKAAEEKAAVVKAEVTQTTPVQAEVKPAQTEESIFKPAKAKSTFVEAAPKAKKMKLPQGNKYYGTGRRKEATAQVWIQPGKGAIIVNGKEMNVYLCNRKLLEFKVTRPLVVTNTRETYDVYAKASGGGVPGQAGAVCLGIARALLQLNPDFRVKLKRAGLLSRDPRMKERKKYGLKRARKAFQYTKR